MDINERVNAALQAWADLIGINEKGEIQKKNPFSSFEMTRDTEELNQSRSLDKTGLTTFMMLRGLTEAYLKAVKFSAFDLILNPSAIGSQLRPMKGLRDILESPDVVSLIRDYQEQLRDSALHYKVKPGKPMDELETLVTDKLSLAYIRRDAFRSVEGLKVHQFTQGASDPLPLQFNPQVFEFWNINSLLMAMRAQRVSGISLCLIRDPEDPLWSYFVFAIRNGQTLTILTDQEETPHPDHRYMSRRPDRTMDRRACKNWFPYHLLDLKKHTDEDGTVKRITPNVRKQLVRMNVEAVPLVNVCDLGAAEFIWTILMFDLIRERFWKQDHKVRELSYTGEMVVEPAALIGRDAAIVKDGLYRPLEVSPLTKDDVTAETTKKQWARKVTGHNRWMVDRYNHLVPDEILNPVGEEARALLQAKIEPDSGSDDSLSVWPSKASRGDLVKTLGPTTFGTKKEIERDRLWVARSNQMVIIQRAAEEEFDREMDIALQSFRDAVEKNMPNILDACARGELTLPSISYDTFSAKVQKAERNCFTQKVQSRWDWETGYVGCGCLKNLRFGTEISGNKVLCYERTDTVATVFSYIRPNNPAALAALAGVEVKDLHWGLQQWFRQEPYVGNSILERLDPEDWRLTNPWIPGQGARGLNLNITIAHSKGALHARRKALGLPRKEFTEEE